jgi:hypothetical protein
MKLTDLEPRWFSTGDSMQLEGISFLCPHCRQSRLGVLISNAPPHTISVPYDEDITHLPSDRQVWQISGAAPTFDGMNHGGFDNVTLTPSVDASKSGHWHGFITNGEIK